MQKLLSKPKRDVKKTYIVFLTAGLFIFFFSLLAPQKIYAVSVSDNFNRADGGLGGNWTTVSGTNAPQIVSNVLQTGTAGTLNAAFWSADAFGNDQWVQGAMPNSIGSEQGPGIAVRLANSRGYFLWFGNASNVVSIWRMDNATTWVELAQSNTLTVTGNDVWKLTVQGSSLKGYQNGNQVVSATDTNYTTGSPGVWMFNSTNQIDDWSGSDDSYSVGGTVSGLSGTVILQNNSGDNISVNSNGSFTFNTKLFSNFSYNVTVKSYPTGQTCSIANGTGTITSSNITSVSVTCTNSPSVTSATDNFNITDGSLSPNWTDMSDGGLTISSQEVVGTNGIGGNSGDMRTEESYTSNQYSEIQVSSTPLSGGQWIGPMVRAQSNGDVYNCIYYWNNGNPYLQVFKRISGTWTGFNSYASGALAAGTKIRLEAIGSTLVVYVNGVEKITAHDTSLTGGAPGIMADGTPKADNWAGGNAPDFAVNYLSTDANGVDSYDMISETNGPGAQTLRILRPTNPTSGVRHSFIYILPVEAGLGNSFGDGMDTLRTLNAQNQYNLTLIEPSFGIEPWYANNPNNTDYQEETFMTTDLVPWVKANLATTGYEQSWMIGFSKSGIGGMDLFLKHPDIFTLEAAWDWPADINAYDEYGASSSTSYGTDANFQANYRLTSAFMDAHKTPFLTDNRIWIGGYNTFQTDVSDFDALLASKGMIHTTETPTNMLHRWDSGWVPLALSALYQDSINLPDTTAPTVTDFTVPASSGSQTFTITSFTAKDDIGVTGYKITESSTAPSATGAGWSTTAPATYSASSGGTKTLYAWAKDAAGNVSTSLHATVTFTATNTSSTSSTSSTSNANPNVHKYWSNAVSAGPNFVGIPDFIFNNSLGQNAMVLIGNDASTIDVAVTINKLSGNALIHLLPIDPFPWMQGLNTVSDIYQFNSVSAFNGYAFNQYDKPVTVVLSYDPAMLHGVNPNKLRIAWYDTTANKWKLLENNTVLNQTNHTIANTTTTLTYFAIVYPPRSFNTRIKVLGANAFNEKNALHGNHLPNILNTQNNKKTCILFICW